MTAPAQPLLLYLGSKFRLAPWIIAHMPPHDRWVDLFGGSGAVTLRKPPARVEVYNDLDGELVNLFRVLRSPDWEELARLVAFTPYARAEFDASYEPSNDPLERARRLILRLQMGYGSSSTRTDRTAGWRTDTAKSLTQVARVWQRMPDVIATVARRFMDVQIENRPALEVLADWQDPETLVYVDPPYPGETRSKRCKRGEGYHSYRHDMTAADHAELLEAVRSSPAMVLLSSYATPQYDTALAGWERAEIDARSVENRKRREVLYINPAAWSALRGDLPLWRGSGDGLAVVR